MVREYEIFEVLPNGSTRRISAVSGLEFAHRGLKELAKHTSNECFAADAKTRQVVAQMNVPQTKRRLAKRIFHIAYNEELGVRRAELLRSSGYGVISVIGNERAKILLSSIQHYDLFIVGHAAPEQTRKEMVDWLKLKYPKVKILALNPSHQELSTADYNVLQNGPENWLAIVAQQ
jgi:hypothetical protein